MRTKILALVALAALILAVIVSISPHATAVANEVTGEIYAVATNSTHSRVCTSSNTRRSSFGHEQEPVGPRRSGLLPWS